MARKIPTLTREFLLSDREAQDNYKASFESLKLNVKKKPVNVENVPKNTTFSH